MEKAFRAILIGIAVLVFVGSVYAYPSGIPGVSQTGCTCHGESIDTQTNVTITGMPAQYTPGNTYLLTITVTSTSISGTTGGFDLNVTAGTLSTDDPNAKIMNGEATHKNKNARSWQVNWTAPTGPAQAVFYVAGLASDGSGEGGDALNTAVYNLSVIPEFPVMTVLLAFAAVSTMTLILARKRLLRLHNKTG